MPEGDVRRHANGVTGVGTITVQVGDMPASVARYRALLGRDPMPASSVEGAAVGASFALGPSRLRLVPGPGAGVIALTLNGPAPRVLPRAQTQGAAIDIAPASTWA